MLAMNAGLASSPARVVATVSMAPAEKPTMPIRCGSTPHSPARSRTRAKAARASAICGPRPAIASAGSMRRGGPPANISRIDCSKAFISAGVWLSRYFSTNAATPRSASARATSQPSFSIDRVRKPPPGATITAVPVALAGSGRNGVRVATVTLRAKTLSYWRCHDSAVPAPGSAPVPSSMASGWAGIAIGTIASSCARAAGMADNPARANSQAAAWVNAAVRRSARGVDVIGLPPGWDDSSADPCAGEHRPASAAQ